VNGANVKLLYQYLAVAAAGSVGAVLRLAVAVFCKHFFPTRFPLGTFIINITGSLFLGWFLTYADRHILSDTTKMAIGVGFVGAYTTFSTFMWESNGLARDGLTLEAIANIVGSIAVGLLAVRVGIWIGQP